MKFKCNKLRIQYNEDKQAEIVLSTKENIHIEELKEIISKGKELSCELKQFRNRRSLDSNSYMWLLLSKMADVMKTTKDELYIEVLSRFGVFTHIVVKPEVVSRVIEQWKVVRELGEVTINGTKGMQLQCFFSSSTYDSKEMSVLIEGVVSECKELGIETITPNELSLMNSQWGGK